jgi:hypothetical protein
VVEHSWLDLPDVPPAAVTLFLTAGLSGQHVDPRAL